MFEDIKSLIERTPFEPFTIIANSGDRYDVTQPNNVSLLKDKVFYAFPDKEHWVFIPLRNIAAVQSLIAA